MKRRLITAIALCVALCGSTLAQNNWATPGGGAADGSVNMCLNAAGEAVPVSSGQCDSTTYNTIAASQTAQALHGVGSGATGDYLSHCVISPGTTSPGNVIIYDNSTAIYTFTGGSSSVSNLTAFAVPIGALSISGPWKITTGANVTVLCVGKFT